MQQQYALSSDTIKDTINCLQNKLFFNQTMPLLLSWIQKGQDIAMSRPVSQALHCSLNLLRKSQLGSGNPYSAQYDTNASAQIVHCPTRKSQSLFIGSLHCFLYLDKQGNVVQQCATAQYDSVQVCYQSTTPLERTTLSIPDILESVFIGLVPSILKPDKTEFLKVELKNGAHSLYDSVQLGVSQVIRRGFREKLGCHS